MTISVDVYVSIRDLERLLHAVCTLLVSCLGASCGNLQGLGAPRDADKAETVSSRRSKLLQRQLPSIRHLVYLRCIFTGTSERQPLTKECSPEVRE